ncbi:MAG: hypothetical protein AVDCRST_MAG08-112, partial [uncultured Acetobacteraceae bacterium]
AGHRALGPGDDDTMASALRRRAALFAAPALAAALPPPQGPRLRGDGPARRRHADAERLRPPLLPRQHAGV